MVGRRCPLVPVVATWKSYLRSPCICAIFRVWLATTLMQLSPVARDRLAEAIRQTFADLPKREHKERASTTGRAASRDSFHRSLRRFREPCPNHLIEMFAQRNPPDHGMLHDRCPGITAPEYIRRYAIVLRTVSPVPTPCVPVDSLPRHRPMRGDQGDTARYAVEPRLVGHDPQAVADGRCRDEPPGSWGSPFALVVPVPKPPWRVWPAAGPFARQRQ